MPVLLDLGPCRIAYTYPHRSDFRVDVIAPRQRLDRAVTAQQHWWAVIAAHDRHPARVDVQPRYGHGQNPARFGLVVEHTVEAMQAVRR